MSEAVDTFAPEFASKRMGRKQVYNWSSMEIGKKYIVNVKLGNVSAAANMFAKRQSPPWRFSCKTVTPTQTEIVRKQ